MEDNRPNYYAIIPAVIRYDTRLKDKAKLLYGEITALCNKEGYCWATNKYFADLYDVTIKCISQLINQLKKYGYINIEMIYEDNSSKIKQRNIYVSESSILTKSSIGIEQKVNTPMEQKVKDNNTSINTTINSTTTTNMHESATTLINQTNIDIDKGAQRAPNAYIIPTKEEVLEFGKSIGSKFDLDYFYNYYDVVNWKDKSGNHFDWKQKMLVWNSKQEDEIKEEIKKNRKVTNIPKANVTKEYASKHNEL